MPCAHCLLSGLLQPTPDSKPTICSIFKVTYLDVPSRRAGHPVLCTTPASPALVSVSIWMKEGIYLKCIDDQVSTCFQKKSFSDFSSSLGKAAHKTCRDLTLSSPPAALYLAFSALTALPTCRSAYMKFCVFLTWPLLLMRPAFVLSSFSLTLLNKITFEDSA